MDALAIPPKINPITSPPVLRTMNGIGGRIVGSYGEPAIPGHYYKQFAITFLFVPIFFGHIYLVSNAKSGWYFKGYISGADFIERFGWKAYSQFKLSAAFESGLFLIAFVGIFFLIAFIREGFRG
jgi:hypothetical protein